ncbi:hypothetical protein GWK48_11165 [Metallosphaera tengchongensis]|uniref:Uncharacterized protein n=1 Tax=Metallosphaera tengchongensis TaxID=1532350 RepID=A0A6N0NZA2_9CREN|nr:hypothetical protein [Metallosphaera tengchongensis]QKR00869.1 hypothetical protein GWK48_11165 [Metallosphaera tengchongensis]
MRSAEEDEILLNVQKELRIPVNYVCLDRGVEERGRNFVMTAVDINVADVVIGKDDKQYVRITRLEDAHHYKSLAEGLQRYEKSGKGTTGLGLNTFTRGLKTCWG